MAQNFNFGQKFPRNYKKNRQKFETDIFWWKWRQVNFEYKYTWNYKYIRLYLIFREKNSKLHHWKSNLSIFWFFFENARNVIKITSFLIGLELISIWLAGAFSYPIWSIDFDFNCLANTMTFAFKYLMVLNWPMRSEIFVLLSARFEPSGKYLNIEWEWIIQGRVSFYLLIIFFRKLNDPTMYLPMRLL